ncbi:MAG: DUF2135 domain-containing protein [Thermoguttaceae bacterium]|nr:DUF2135 domain-containing protein [Thermoguttaceae bacterium]
MNRYFIAAMMALLTMPMFAQDVLEPELPIIEPPTIFVPPSRLKDLKPIELTGYETSVRVTGFVCQTEITMTFYNPNHIQLAGDLVFPLPEGVTVSGYALDIEGAMVDAVAVTKEKARVTLEKEMRRGADPGIVERQRGNQFKTRIFPLPVQGTRTVKIKYVTTATFDVECVAARASGRGYASEKAGVEDSHSHLRTNSVGKGVAIYRQPVRLAKPVKNFSMTVDVIRPVEKPTLVAGDLGELNFGTWSDGLRAEVKKENFQTDKDIVLEIPLVDAQTVRVEKSEDGFAYFAIATSLKPEAQETKENAVPQNVAVYWDCSGSRSVTGRAGEQTKELAFLTSWLKANHIESVRLIPVRNTIEADEIQTVKTDELVAKISALPGDGATNLSVIESVAKEDELALLFTDGFANWGDQTNLKVPGRLFAFSSGISVDATYLKRVTAANGGKYINLETLTTDNAVKAFDLALTKSDSTVQVEASDAQAYPSQLDKNSPAAVQFICGRTDKASAVVELKSTDLRFEIKVDDTTVKGETLRTMYAQTLLAELELSPKENQTAIEDLGKTFGLTTSETSLIVLESLEQYLEHGIEPPKSQPKLREAYLAEMQYQNQQKEKSLKEKKEERYSYLSRIWKERTEWYNKKFEPSAWSKLKKFAQRSFGGNAPADGRALEEADAVPEVMEERVVPQMNAAPAPAYTPPLADDEDGAVVEEAEVEEADEAFGDAEEEAADNAVVGAGGGAFSGAAQQAEKNRKSVSMEIKQWQPDSPYLKIMSASDDPYSAYLAIRGEYDRSPSFYLECAEFFKAKGDLVKATRVLSNLAEMDLEAPQVLRVLGYRLLQYDNPVESVPVFEVVLKMRPEEPQSYRDLAIALTRRAEVSADTAKDDYSRALELYQTLIWGRDYENWDGRFGDVELFALEESNAMLEAAKKAGVTEIPLTEEFIRPVDVDIRIVMTWSADNTDIDLHVIEPSGEKVFYGHKLSVAGGMISRDFTGGYGPEEYMIHKAPKGTYKIQAHYYASHAVELLGAVTVQADVYTNFGRPNQKRQSLTFPLKDDGKDVYDIGEITFEK